MVEIPLKFAKPFVLKGSVEKRKAIGIVRSICVDALDGERRYHGLGCCFLAGRDDRQAAKVGLWIPKGTLLYRVEHTSGGIWWYCGDCLEPLLRERGIIW